MEHGYLIYGLLVLIALALAVLAGATGYLFELLNEHAVRSKNGEEVDLLALCSKPRLVALALCGIYPTILLSGFSFIGVSVAFGDRLTTDSVLAISVLTGSLSAFFPIQTYRLLKRRFPALLSLAIDDFAEKITPGGNGNAENRE